MKPCQSLVKLLLCTGGYRQLQLRSSEIALLIRKLYWRYEPRGLTALCALPGALTIFANRTRAAHVVSSAASLSALPRESTKLSDFTCQDAVGQLPLVGPIRSWPLLVHLKGVTTSSAGGIRSSLQKFGLGAAPRASR